MKNIRFWLFVGLLVPCNVFGATGSDFQNATKLLSAARRGDMQTVQALITAGADVNYVDSTGLSLVCTAVMNNDKRTIQILQRYGADASDCDKQIKQYKRKTNVATKGEEYDFFSGLSSSHVVALSAVGVAAVIGGVALLTDAFDSENNNNASSSGGSHGSGSGGSGGNGSGEASKLFALDLPYGPACDSATSCPTDFSVWEKNNQDFDYMSDNGFNYLMVSHAYNSFVRGYLGMSTVRIADDKTPFNLSLLPYVEANVNNKNPVDGGKPVNVAMITGSGVNVKNTDSSANGTITWVDAASIPTVQSVCNANGNNSALCYNALSAATKTSNKYYNEDYKVSHSIVGQDDTKFDLSGSGIVFGVANKQDTTSAKIIAGWEYGGRASGDYYGFIPNGQLTVYKTGAGSNWVEPEQGSAVTGSYTLAGMVLSEDDTLTLADGTVLRITDVAEDSVDGSLVTAVAQNDNSKIYNAYIINNKLYIDSLADGNINQIYEFSTTDNAMTLIKELSTTPSDYRNYYAMRDALQLQGDDNKNVTNIIANLSLPDSSNNLEYDTVSSAKASYNLALNAHNETVALQQYYSLINKYYDLQTNDNLNAPATDAKYVFEYISDYQRDDEQYMLINPAGWSKYAGALDASVAAQVATFENFAPAIFTKLQNLFVTVVSAFPNKGTDNITIDGYAPTDKNKIVLSNWVEDGVTYRSRICGLTGTGNDGAVNPWCFTAPGVTNIDATAAMAGGVALVQSAFSYASPKQIFLLLALTADGPYLGTNPDTGNNWTDTDELITYLKNMYTLPGEFDVTNANYLDNFKQVFGYGMINLERATRPGTNVYVYNADKNTIVSSSGKTAYWRSATTSYRSSGALSLAGRGDVNISFYDIMESMDGTLSLPRVWKNTFTLGFVDNKHGLYMGDVLGDFNIDSTNKHSNQIGNLRIDMAMSTRAYNDNLNGLDNMRISWANDSFDFSTEYQRYLTDGESRFNGRANAVLGLMSDTLSANTMYKIGHFAFGGRGFVGAMTDENLLDTDPTVSSQFEPMRLGLTNGGSFDAKYVNDKFGLNMSFGVMYENNTVLGMLTDGMLAMNNAKTNYVDALATYKPFDNVKLSLRGTFALTSADNQSEFISQISDIKSNAFAFGMDFGGFEFTFALPLAVTDGKLGYGYADFDVVENGGKYEIAVNNAHTEYIDLSVQKRELRFSTSYKRALGEFTDAGVGLIYRINPNNMDVFGNESILMFKIHHRLGI